MPERKQFVIVLTSSCSGTSVSSSLCIWDADLNLLLTFSVWCSLAAARTDWNLDNGSPEKSWQRGEIKLSGPLKIRLIYAHLNCATFAAKWSKQEKTILLKLTNSTCAATVWSKVWKLIFAESVDLFVSKIYQVWLRLKLGNVAYTRRHITLLHNEYSNHFCSKHLCFCFVRLHINFC